MRARYRGCPCARSRESVTTGPSTTSVSAASGAMPATSPPVTAAISARLGGSRATSAPSVEGGLQLDPVVEGMHHARDVLAARGPCRRRPRRFRSPSDRLGDRGGDRLPAVGDLADLRRRVRRAGARKHGGPDRRRLLGSGLSSVTITSAARGQRRPHRRALGGVAVAPAPRTTTIDPAVCPRSAASGRRRPRGMGIVHDGEWSRPAAGRCDAFHPARNVRVGGTAATTSSTSWAQLQQHEGSERGVNPVEVPGQRRAQIQRGVGARQGEGSRIIGVRNDSPVGIGFGATGEGGDRDGASAASRRPHWSSTQTMPWRARSGVKSDAFAWK